MPGCPLLSRDPLRRDASSPSSLNAAPPDGRHGWSSPASVKKRRRTSIGEAVAGIVNGEVPWSALAENKPRRQRRWPGVISAYPGPFCLRGRALAARRELARSRSAGAERIRLRPVERAYRAARQSGRGRPARAARYLPELLLRGQAAAVRGARLRLPGDRADRLLMTVSRSATGPSAMGPRWCACPVVPAGRAGTSVTWAA
jgi:hypothetical protein